MNILRMNVSQILVTPANVLRKIFIKGSCHLMSWVKQLTMCCLHDRNLIHGVVWYAGTLYSLEGGIRKL